MYWHSSSGLITEESVVTNGVATTTLTPNSEEIGLIYVTAKVGQTMFVWTGNVTSSAPLYLVVQNRTLIPAMTDEDGNAITRPDGTPIDVPYFTSTFVDVYGPPNSYGTVIVDSPVELIALRGVDAHNGLGLDATGRAQFEIVTLEQFAVFGRVQIKVKVNPEGAAYVKTTDPTLTAYVSDALWGFIGADTENAGGMLGGVVGGYFSVADFGALVKNVFRKAGWWKGTPNVLEATLAGAGILSTLSGPADGFVSAARVLIQRLGDTPLARLLWKSVQGVIKSDVVDAAESAFLQVLRNDDQLVQIYKAVIEDSDELYAAAVRSSDKLGASFSSAVKNAATDPSIGIATAKKLTDIVGSLSDDVLDSLRGSGVLDDAISGLTRLVDYGVDSKVISDVLKKTDLIAPHELLVGAERMLAGSPNAKGVNYLLESLAVAGTHASGDLFEFRAAVELGGQGRLVQVAKRAVKKGNNWDDAVSVLDHFGVDLITTDAIVQVKASENAIVEAARRFHRIRGRENVHQKEIETYLVSLYSMAKHNVPAEHAGKPFMLLGGEGTAKYLDGFGLLSGNELRLTWRQPVRTASGVEMQDREITMLFRELVQASPLRAADLSNVSSGQGIDEWPSALSSKSIAIDISAARLTSDGHDATVFEAVEHYSGNRSDGLSSTAASSGLRITDLTGGAVGQGGEGGQIDPNDDVVALGSSVGGNVGGASARLVTEYYPLESTLSGPVVVVALIAPPANEILSVGGPSGSKLLVNSTADDYQELPAVAVAADGRFLAVWSSYHADGGIYGKLFNSDGTVAKDEFLISNIIEGFQVNPDVAVDPVAGTFVVTWQNDSLPGVGSTGGSDVYARAFTSDGTPVGEQILVNDADGDHYNPSVAFTESGGFVIAWDAFTSSNESKIFARHFTTANAVDGATLEVSTVAGGVFPAVGSAGDGSFVVAWESTDGDGRGVLVRQFAADDTPVGDPVLVNAVTAGDQTAPGIAVASDGSYVIAWCSEVGTASQILARRFLANGDPAGDEFRVDQSGTAVPLAPSVTLLPTGGFLVAWTELSQGGTDREVRVREFASDGTPVGDSYALSTTSAGDQQTPDVAAAADVLVGVWAGESAAGGDLDIYARIFSLESETNEPPTVSLTNTVASLPENTTVQTRVADIVVTDDETGTNTLGLTGPDAAMFEIVGTSLYLKAGQNVDFETQPQLQVTVTVDDATLNGTPDDSVSAVLSVSDINEPPSIALENLDTEVAENTDVQTKLADIVVTDDALGTNVLDLTGPDAAMFEIVGTSLYLKAGQNVDFETDDELQVTVTVDDATVGSTPDASVPLVLSVLDINEPPTAVAGGPYEIDEGGSLALDAAGSSDPDGDPLTYSWDINGDGTFGDASGRTVTLSWNQLASMGIADDGLWQVSIQANDDEGLTGQAFTTLTVRNVAPAITSLTTNAGQPGDIAAGQAVTLSASFTDSGLLDAHTAQVDWGDGSGLEDVPVTEDSGAGTVSASHVYPAGGVYQILLAVADNALASDTAGTTAFVTGVRLSDGVLQIVGGNGNDIITIDPSGATQIFVQASLTGAGVLRRYYDTADVTAIRIFAAGGNDRVTVSSQLQFQVLIDGGAGSDQLQGGGGPNLLLGGDGDDVISGGNDRDLLIGGSGVDQLTGYAGDDILVAGAVLNDLDELAGLLQQWTAAGSYGQRVADVVDQLQWQLDEDVESLYGGSERDLLCASAVESFKDKAAEDISRWFPDYLAVSPVLTNFVEPCDTNRDGSVWPLDVLLVINYLNLFAALPAAVDAMAAQWPRLYLDVDMNYRITPADALQIVNRLNSIAYFASSSAAGEGEGQADVRPLPSVVGGLDASGRDRWAGGPAKDVAWVFRPARHSGEPCFEEDRHGRGVAIAEFNLLDAAFANDDGGLDELDELLTVLAEDARLRTSDDLFDF